MNTNKTLYIIIGLLIVVLFIQRSCNSQYGGIEKQKVIVPEVKGEFIKPVAIIREKTKKDSIVFIKGTTIHTENPFNKRMAELYLQAQRENDSLKQFKMYVDAIQEIEETQVFDDEVVKLDITVKTRGELLSLKPKYTVKERKVEVNVKQKEQVFALYGGVGVSDNKQFNNLNIQVELGFQLRSGDILSATADSRQNFGIKYTKQIFKIKR